MIFVSHNLATVRYVSDVLAVMYLGRIVEVGPTDAVVSDPQHPYTRTLLDAVPAARADEPRRGAAMLEAGPARPAPPAVAAVTSIHAARSARWSTRRRQICIEQDPSKGAHARPHRAACHFAGRDRELASRNPRGRRRRCRSRSIARRSRIGSTISASDTACRARRVAVLHDGDVAHAASGILNLDTGVEATTDSLFQIGSITKVWTATLVMQLVEEGRVDLDAPVRRYLPGLPRRRRGRVGGGDDPPPADAHERDRRRPLRRHRPRRRRARRLRRELCGAAAGASARGDDVVLQHRLLDPRPHRRGRHRRGLGRGAPHAARRAARAGPHGDARPRTCCASAPRSGTSSRPATSSGPRRRGGCRAPPGLRARSARPRATSLGVRRAPSRRRGPERRPPR